MYKEKIKNDQKYIAPRLFRKGTVLCSTLPRRLQRNKSKILCTFQESTRYDTTKNLSNFRRPFFFVVPYLVDYKEKGVKNALYFQESTTRGTTKHRDLLKKTRCYVVWTTHSIFLCTCPRLRVSAGHVALYLGKMTNFVFPKKRRRGHVKHGISTHQKYSNIFEGPIYYKEFLYNQARCLDEQFLTRRLIFSSSVNTRPTRLTIRFVGSSECEMTRLWMMMASINRSRCIDSSILVYLCFQLRTRCSVSLYLSSVCDHALRSRTTRLLYSRCCFCSFRKSARKSFFSSAVTSMSGNTSLTSFNNSSSVFGSIFFRKSWSIVLFPYDFFIACHMILPIEKNSRTEKSAFVMPPSLSAFLTFRMHLYMPLCANLP